MEINIKVEVSHVDLFEAVCFVMGGRVPAHANQVIADIFSTPIAIDFSRLENMNERIFHLNGFVAIMSTLRCAMEEMDRKAEEDAKPKIITLNP